MDERREYFRISDMAFAVAEPWDNSQESIPEYFPQLRSLVMQNELENFNDQIKSIMARMDDDEIKELLEIQNRKVDLMARFFAAIELTDNQIKPQQISIGEGGICFSSNNELNIGMDIAVAVVFTPSYLPIFAKAKVVNKESAPKAEQSNDTHILHCEFYKLPEKTRQPLAKHLLKQQTRNRRTDSD